ncbi:hypothetical protein D9M71_694870 [compost metagenome]
MLRDLAEYQDTVVGWVDDWSNADHNERNYLLACYIESLSQLSPADVGYLADASDKPADKALFTDLEQLPEPDRERTRQALLDYLNRGGKVEGFRHKKKDYPACWVREALEGTVELQNSLRACGVLLNRLYLGEIPRNLLGAD